MFGLLLYIKRSRTRVTIGEMQWIWFFVLAPRAGTCLGLRYPLIALCGPLATLSKRSTEVRVARSRTDDAARRPLCCVELPASDGQRCAEPGGRGRWQRRRGQRRRGRRGRRRGRGQPGRRPRGRGQSCHRPASHQAAPSAFLQLLRGLDERRPGVPPATLRGRAAQRPRGQTKRRNPMLGHLLWELLRQLGLWELLL